MIGSCLIFVSSVANNGRSLRILGLLRKYNAKHNRNDAGFVILPICQISIAATAHFLLAYASPIRHVYLLWSNRSRAITIDITGLQQKVRTEWFRTPAVMLAFIFSIWAIFFTVYISYNLGLARSQGYANAVFIILFIQRHLAVVEMPCEPSE